MTLYTRRQALAAAAIASGYRCLDAATLSQVRLGVTTDEICTELGITANNCWVLIYRARMSLRECLEKRWFATGHAQVNS